MIKILFICHGNICRSPMGMFILRDMVQKRGVASQFLIDSAATSTEEIGNGLYPPARRKLEAEGIPCTGHRARQLTRADYAAYDLLLGADSANLHNMRRICGGDPDGKIRRLLDYSAPPRDIADPWYTDDFDTAYRDIVEGCEALLAQLGY
jgi:protein-tyrosine phosphatase